MPYAYKERDGSFAVESTIRNMMLLADLAPIAPNGASLLVGANAVSSFIGRDPEARIHGPIGGFDACNSCKQKTACLMGGGVADIVNNVELWPGCGILKNVSSINDSDTDVPYTGFLYRDVTYSEALLLTSDTLKDLGFTVVTNKLYFRRPEQWEIDIFHDIDRGVTCVDEDFTDRFLVEKNDAPVYPSQFDWRPIAQHVYKSYKTAQGVKAGKKNSVTAKFKRDECKLCVYKCNLSHWMVTDCCNKKNDNARDNTSCSPVSIHAPCSPTVSTNKRCAVRQSELEAQFDGSETQIRSVMAHMIGGKRFDTTNERKRNKDAMILGQDWSNSGCGWRYGGGRLVTRSLVVGYEWLENMTLEDACEVAGVNIDDIRRQVMGLGDRLPITFWALKHLGLMCCFGEERLWSGSRYSRNDVLSIRLTINRSGPHIAIGSDTLASNHGGRQYIGDRIETCERPRFSTYYEYPFFKDIQANTGKTPGSGK